MTWKALKPASNLMLFHGYLGAATDLATRLDDVDAAFFSLFAETPEAKT